MVVHVMSLKELTFSNFVSSHTVAKVRRTKNLCVDHKEIVTDYCTVINNIPTFQSNNNYNKIMTEKIENVTTYCKD